MGNPTQNTTRATTAQNRFVDVFREKADLLSFMTALTDETQALENAFFQLFTGFNVNTAVGTQLDAIGAVVGVSRNGATDTVYRIRVRARIMINLSSGTPNQILRMVNLLTPDGTASKFRPFYPASFEVETTGPLSTSDAKEIGSALIEMTPAGVNSGLLYSEVAESDTFVFADSTAHQDSTTQGFGSPDGLGLLWSDKTLTGIGATDTMNAMAFGAGKYVIVGNGESLAYSTDANTWSAATDPVAAGGNWLWVIYAASKFVAGASDGKIITSTDGVTWSVSATLTAGHCNSATFGNSLFVCCGSGSIYSSPDAVTWTLQHTLGVGAAYNVTYLGGLFLCGGSSGALATSANGTSWNNRTSNMGGNNIFRFAHSGSLYICVGSGGALSSSPDGTTWTARTSNIGAGDDILDATYGGGVFVIAATSNGSTNVAYSSNGTSWTASEINGSNNNRGVFFLENVFAVVGASGQISTSSDGATWQSRVSSGDGFGTESTHCSGIFGVNSRMFAFGSNRRLMVSEDGAVLGGGKFAGIISNT